MQKKWFVRIICIVLAVLLVGSLIFGAINSLSAKAATLDELKDNEQRLKEKQEEVQKQIESLEYDQATTMAQKLVLDEQIALTEDEIENCTAQIDELVVQIAIKEVEYVNNKIAEEKQLETYKKRIRNMEENGTITYLAVLFESKSFSDLLARIDFISEIMEYDQQLYHQLEEARMATAAVKKELEDDKAELELKQQELEEKKALLEQQLNESIALIQAIEDDIEQYRNHLDEIEADQKRVDEEIAAALAAAEAAAQAAERNGGGSGDGGNSATATGNFIWPAPASKVITSPFGPRFHPIYHEWRQHTGVDIGAGYGTNIVAADSGTVIVSTYSSSYGNYVVINHGGGVTTLYAHLSTLYVSVGENVAQGEVIGLCGSTGASTGPHLHFEVSIGGTRVNPLNYFSDYIL